MSTGRAPYDSFETTSYGMPSGRLKPPDSLPKAEKTAFLALVASCPAGQFQPCDVPLIARWAELSIMCEQAAAMVRDEGMVGADGKPSGWFVAHQRLTRTLAAIGSRLKVGPSCRQPRAPKVQVRPMSYFDEQRLLREGDADGETSQ
jgi:hypothetical protein